MYASSKMARTRLTHTYPKTYIPKNDTYIPQNDTYIHQNGTYIPQTDTYIPKTYEETDRKEAHYKGAKDPPQQK